MKPGRNRKGKYSSASAQKRKGTNLAVTVFLDALMVGLILVVFAFFHHVLPAVISEYDRMQESAVATEQPAEPETAPTQIQETQPTEPEATQMQTLTGETDPVETEPATEAPDLRTPWQKQFAEHFSEEVVLTENSYKIPNFSLTL